MADMWDGVKEVSALLAAIISAVAAWQARRAAKAAQAAKDIAARIPEVVIGQAVLMGAIKTEPPPKAGV